MHTYIILSIVTLWFVFSRITHTKHINKLICFFFVLDPFIKWIDPFRKRGNSFDGISWASIQPNYCTYERERRIVCRLFGSPVRRFWRMTVREVLSNQSPSSQRRGCISDMVALKFVYLFVFAFAFVYFLSIQFKRWKKKTNIRFTIHL